jgi:hypothetical protein
MKTAKIKYQMTQFKGICMNNPMTPPQTNHPTLRVKVFERPIGAKNVLLVAKGKTKS